MIYVEHSHFLLMQFLLCEPTESMACLLARACATRRLHCSRTIVATSEMRHEDSDVQGKVYPVRVLAEARPCVRRNLQTRLWL